LTVLALAMLFTSGSRGGLLGLAVFVAGGVFAARMNWKRTLIFGSVAGLAAIVLAFAHPRTRALFAAPAPSAVPNASNLQRSAMIRAGVAMGVERPLVGWGSGTTPLAYPRFRFHPARNGVENVLQLHSLPLQIWAELGGVGLGLGTWLVVLGLSGFRREPLAAVALGAYLIFALTDYQLDVPVFACALAVLAALLAPPAPPAFASQTSRAVSLMLRATLVVLVCFARRDPTPEMNVRALELGKDPSRRAEAIELLTTSLALNPDQEIAHFNLAWLLVVDQPHLAEEHFIRAIRLVPDKGGVYFGLGLAYLNQGKKESAANAFAQECVNDPVFFVSPWWKDPAVASTRAATLTATRRLLSAHSDSLSDWAKREDAYLLALIDWLEDPDPAPARPLALANTSERVAFFSRRPAKPDFAAAPLLIYRRERAGYPVLMRNLNLRVPVDLFDVQENALATGEFRFLFPHKGWLNFPP
jgi:tetratricopeptide (TPR) repeat protein